MSAAALIAELGGRGIELTVTGDRVRWRAPKGVMTGEMIEVLRLHKSAVLALLTFLPHKPRRPALSPVPLTEVCPVAEGDEWLADEFYQLRRRARAAG